MMLIEHPKRYTFIKPQSIIDRNTNDFIEDNLDALKLRKIAKKAKKIHDLTKERNLIEEKRLEFMKTLLRKQHGQVDARWNSEYLKMRKILNNINEKSQSKFNQNNNNNNENSSINSSNKDSIGSSSHNNCSTLSLFATNSVLIQSNLTLPQSHQMTNSVTSSSQMSKIFTNKKSCAENGCKYNQDNCFSKLNLSCYIDAEVDQKSIKETPLPESKPITPKAETPISTVAFSQSVLSTTTLSSTKSSCNLYPCALLHSYTSILGAKNDRRVKTAPARLESRKSYNTFNVQTENSEEVEIESFAKTEYELSQIEVENFNKKVSIRRPLRQTHSLKDFQFKINALEAQAKFCKEQNYANFKPSDRNIRYGAPLERKKIFRQLKILAEFDKCLA